MKETDNQLQQIHEAVTAVRELHERGANEYRDNIVAANASISELTKAVSVIQQRMDAPGFGNTADPGAMSDAEQKNRSAFEGFIRRGERPGQEYNRSLGGTSDTDGGFLLPAEFASEVVTNAYNEAVIRPFANVGTTGNGSVVFPSMASPTVAWGKATLTAQSSSTGATTAQVQPLRALVKIHVDVLNDAQADIFAELGMLFSDATAEAEDIAFVIGQGHAAEQPLGILSVDSIKARYTPSGVAAAISDASNNGTDALIKMAYAVKNRYRANGIYLMNSATEGAVRVLKDDQGRYLWQPPVQEGSPALFNGRPVAAAEGMPDVAAGTFPVAFGDLRRGYRIRDRQGITVQRLNDLYAEEGMVGFIVTRRVAGAPVLSEAFQLFKIAAS